MIQPLLLNTDLVDYIPILVLIVALLGLGVLLASLSRIMGPFRPESKDTGAYESGMDPIGSAHERFSVKFYLVAMLFILFDIEVIFMYPWAVQYRQLLESYGLFPLIEMLVFMAILFVGYIYIYKKGGLKWA
jgi:NADH-quinone oxidoreductase subunit A